ncbi:MAG: inositol monophosphatase family protein [Chitinispirillia bacterium]|jgi:myo-inositol-1(or 4)-monophosphatase
MKNIVDIGIKAARAAGEFLSENAKKKEKTVYLKYDRSLVTDFDSQAEKIIVDIIRSEFPTHSILAEEGNNTAFSNEYLWIIDPIDGTHNFIRGIPLYGVSIGVVCQNDFVAGFIYMPTENDLYFSEKGNGAFKNSAPIKVSNRTGINECTLSFDSGFRRDIELKTNAFKALAPRVFNIRMLGASTTLLTYLAEGKIDIIVEFDDEPWDFAAGASLVTEAGGKITDFDGRDATFKTKGYICSNGFVHNDVINILHPLKISSLI